MENDKEEKEWKIPLYKIYSDDEDIISISRIIKRGTNWAIGPEIEEFENAIKNYVGCEYCVSLNSGTSALHATLLAYGFGNSDEIIVPSFTFISTVNSTRFVGANPVFCDIEEKTFGLDPKLILNNISNKTKAIMPMDYGGQSCQIQEIKDIAQNHNLALIEDAAEGLGSTVDGKKVGSFSDSAIFSFCGNKVLTTGEGGAVVTNSKDVYEKIKSIRSHGRVDKIPYFENPSISEYIGVGYNWRMSSITATLGLSQLGKLDKLIKLRQENANFLSKRLSKHKEIHIPNPPDGYNQIYQMYSILLENKLIRDNLQIFLLNKRIFCKVYFYPVHLMDYYKKNYSCNSLPMTESISNRILTLPIYPNMTLEEKSFLVDTIDEFFELNNQMP